MNLRNLFRVSGALFMIIGLIWLVAPNALPASYGMSLDPIAAYYVQQLGTVNIALAILLFLVSGMAHSPARQAVVTFILMQQVLSGIVSVFAMFGGVVPGGVGWTGVAFNLVMALAFGYFQFIRPEASMTTGLKS